MKNSGLFFGRRKKWSVSRVVLIVAFSFGWWMPAAPGCRDDSGTSQGLDAGLDGSVESEAEPGDGTAVRDGGNEDGGAADGAVDAEVCPEPRPTRQVWTRTSPNLLEDPHFTDGSAWLHYVRGEYQSGQQPLFDPDESRSPGSGSIRLAYEHLEGGDSDQIVYRGVSVEPDKVYTFSIYAKITSWPPPRLWFNVGFRDAAGHFTHNARSGTSRWGVNEVGEWQELVGFFYPEEQDVLAQPQVELAESLDGDPNQVVWVDDAYFGKGKSFGDPPTPKTPFDGTMTRVDDLGNIEVFRNGQWIPFFPLCIYADGYRPDWSVYSEQGFNCNMWASTAGQVRRGKEAVSAFNPDGMVSGLDFSAYMQHGGVHYNDLDLFRTRIQEIKDQDLMGSLLFWYWDNEHVYGDWAVPMAVTSTIMEMDRDDSNQRMHPIYALNGNYGLTRIYQSSRDSLIEMTGVYITGWGFVDGFVVQDMVGSQPVPPVIAQINLGMGPRFRPALFAAIAVGARGMGHWRDRYPSEPVEDRAWWPQLPQMRRDIDAMIPLIRTPHWTDWSLSCDHGSDVVVGTRTKDCRGHVIAANLSADPVTVTCRISDLVYEASKVTDYFSGDEIGTVDNGGFTLTIGSYDKTVVRLDP